ncbi:hypothetical protein CFT13S00388_07975 [Campylobacter fetus subsp. testudinum]|uniref:hypothetical protein n=1 Tax=Campylobacter fetus TaxID=196 RepID=UPI0008189DF8|nr:hypothetical protein [Campylobacter fetus]OCR86683.1 hypothetical protein CFT13S00388_07975 [Campylobacter fetus subsp. testudinum]
MEIELSAQNIKEMERKDLCEMIKIIEKYPRLKGSQTKLLGALNAYFNYNLQNKCESDACYERNMMFAR